MRMHPPKLLAVLTLFNVVLPCLLAAQKAAPERVAGRITSATDGHPLGHATITLEDVKTGGIAATTDAAEDGSFHFSAVPPGNYRLHGRAKGFAPALYLQHGIYSSAVVTGAGLDIGSLNLQLRPAASISGHVLDEAGEPIPLRGGFMASGANVTLYCEDPSFSARPVHPCGSHRTEEDGSFEFPDLEPGRYYLTASARPWYEVHPPVSRTGENPPFRAAVDPALDVAYSLVFYPHALSSDQAEPLILRAGDQVTANMQMVPERALTIAIPHSGRRGAPRTFPMVSREVFGSQEIMSPVMDSSDDASYILGLPQGQYVLQETSRETPLAVGSQTVNLREQSITLEPPNLTGTSTVTLKIHALNGTPMQAGEGVRLLQNNGMVSAMGRTDAKGIAELSKVPEGDFPLTFDDGQVDYRLTVSGSAATGPRLHVQPGGSLSVDVTAGPPISLQGTARRNGKLSVGAMVVLVPADGDTAPDRFRRDQTDLDGGFNLVSVDPGKYLLVALENGWSLSWTDPHALEPYLLHAQPLLIPATAQGTVHLRQPLAVQQAH